MYSSISIELPIELLVGDSSIENNLSTDRFDFEVELFMSFEEFYDMFFRYLADHNDAIEPDLALYKSLFDLDIKDDMFIVSTNEFNLYDVDEDDIMESEYYSDINSFLDLASSTLAINLRRPQPIKNIISIIFFQSKDIVAKDFISVKMDIENFRGSWVELYYKKYA